MPRPSLRPQPGDRYTVTYRGSSDGRRHQRTFPNRHLADQFADRLAAGQSPTNLSPVPAAAPAPHRTPAPPAHHRSIDPLRQLARTVIDGDSRALLLTFLPAPDFNDVEQDWLNAPTDAQRHLEFRPPR